MNKALRFLIVTGLILAVIGLFNPLFQKNIKTPYINLAQVTNAMAGASAIKIRIYEHYATHGYFPNSNHMLGLPSPGHFNKDGLDSLTIEQGGVIHLAFVPDVGGKTGHIFLIPEVFNNVFVGEWRCITPSYPVISEWMPQCSYQPL